MARQLLGLCSVHSDHSHPRAFRVLDVELRILGEPKGQTERPWRRDCFGSPGWQRTWEIVYDVSTYSILFSGKWEKSFYTKLPRPFAIFWTWLDRYDAWINHLASRPDYESGEADAALGWAKIPYRTSEIVRCCTQCNLSLQQWGDAANSEHDQVTGRTLCLRSRSSKQEHNTNSISNIEGLLVFASRSQTTLGYFLC